MPLKKSAYQIMSSKLKNENAADLAERAAQAETRTEQAHTCAAQTETRAEQAAIQKEQSQTMADQAHTRLAQAATQSEQDKTRTAQAETQTAQAMTWRMEHALRASELSYRRLFEAARDGILILDADTGRITDVNPFLNELLGFSHEEMVGKTVGELSPFADIVSNQTMLERLQSDGYVRYEDLPLKTKDGRQVAVEFVSNVYQAGDKKVIQCNIRDITARKRAEESHARLAMAVEQAAETIMITDPQGMILFANPAFEKISGYTCAEALGQNTSILKSGCHDAEFYRQMWDCLRGGKVWKGHFINRRKDGELYEEDATISPVRNASGTVVNYVSVKRDVTREMQLEVQLRQSQKMESIGQLADGIAHDFNNILGASLLYLGLLQQKPELSMDTKESLKEIEKETIRAANLTRQLLLFSRRQLLKIRSLDLNELINNLLKMMRRLLSVNIEFIFDGSSELACVNADVGMVEQVVMNLCLNARDAMPNGGSLTLVTTLVELEDGLAGPHPDARPGRFVCLSVTDMGCGMDKDVLDHLFEPFFTTKEEGKGTGLGLAIVFRIVKQHQGWVEVESELGRGSSFRVYLPAGTKPDDAPGVSDHEDEINGGSETILIVEDSPPMRRMASLCLRKLGYAVLEAGDGAEALRVWQEHQGKIDLLLTDMVMPGAMTGLDLAVRLKHEKNTLVIIICSGYSGESSEPPVIAGQEIPFLEKPYSGGALAKLVRRCLDQC